MSNKTPSGKNTTDTSSRIWSKVDIWAQGKTSDHFRIPHSTNTSAYGWIPVPFVSIKNGNGPRALLIAGNHGDEYEGQIALRQLARMIEKKDVSGHILILPALNYPAVAAGQRVSPIDEGNLNRLFPGRSDGAPTEMLAHFVNTELLPNFDFVVDLHSGGRSLEFLPCALAKYSNTDSELEKSNLDMLRAFGAPISYLTSGKGGGGQTTLAAAAEALSIPAIMTELGGGEKLNPTGLKIATQGLLRLLRHKNILTSLDTDSPAPATRFMQVRGREDYIYATAHGIFEPLVALGDRVNAGDKAARIYKYDDPSAEPISICFESAGIVACRRAQSQTDIGDCLFHLFSEIDETSLQSDSTTF